MWSAIARRAAPFMAACVFASAINTPASAAPVRVASLNLCTDELVLLLAAPRQIASVTHLSRNRHESALWRVARRFSSNDGTILSIAGMQTDVIVTMGGIARDRERLASRIGARIVALDYPMGLDDIENDVREIAAAIGRERQGERLIQAIRRMRASAPRSKREGLFLSAGGNSLASGSLGAQWLALAGVAVPPDAGSQISAERLLLDPPSLVIRSDYRASQASRGNHWIGFRFLDRASATRTLTTDGRLWTCAGPLLVTEIARLRREIGQ